MAPLASPGPQTGLVRRRFWPLVWFFDNLLCWASSADSNISTINEIHIDQRLPCRENCGSFGADFGPHPANSRFCLAEEEIPAMTSSSVICSRQECSWHSHFWQIRCTLASLVWYLMNWFFGFVRRAHLDAAAAGCCGRRRWPGVVYSYNSYFYC